MDDQSRTVTTQKSPRPVGLRYIIPVGLVIGALLFAGSVYVKQNGFTIPSIPTLDQLNPKPTSPVEVAVTKTQPTITPNPTDAPLSEEDKEDVIIAVLNGSGQAGAAGKAANVLKAAGFTAITTGNAEEYDYSGISIAYAEGNKAAADAVRSALNEEYTVSVPEEKNLSDDTEVEVVIGKTKVDENEEESSE